MERIDGITVREIISAMRRNDEAQLAAWAAMGITPQRTAVILVRSVLEQTFRFRRFNADPHPSNLIVSAGGTLNWVDFGLAGWIDERQWQLQLRLRAAFVEGRVHEAYLMLLRSIEPIPEGRDLRPFEHMTKQAIHDYMIAAENPRGPVSERGTGVFLLRTIQALRRSRLPIAVSTLNLYRTIVIADMVMLRLYPGIDWPGHLQRFLRDMSHELIVASPRSAEESIEGAFRLARAPVALAEVTDWAASWLPQIGQASVAALTYWQRFTSAGLRLLRALSLVTRWPPAGGPGAPG
jgi:predicted unusual protein kinase regulating ubiquinone biosynthesis (AarF/ABC1/UbiB family)